MTRIGSNQVKNCRSSDLMCLCVLFEMSGHKNISRFHYHFSAWKWLSYSVIDRLKHHKQKLLNPSYCICRSLSVFHALRSLKFYRMNGLAQRCPELLRTHRPTKNAQWVNFCLCPLNASMFIGTKPRIAVIKTR